MSDVNFIVFEFDKLIKSNSLILLFELFVRDRNDFYINIMNVRRFFLALINASTYKEKNNKSKNSENKKFEKSKNRSKIFSSVFKAKSIFEISLNFISDDVNNITTDQIFDSFDDEIIDENSKSYSNNRKTVEKFENVKKLFNFHIDMQFDRIMSKYNIL